MFFARTYKSAKKKIKKKSIIESENLLYSQGMIYKIWVCLIGKCAVLTWMTSLKNFDKDAFNFWVNKIEAFYRGIAIKV